MTTILVVEDEAIVATDIAQRLKRGGYDVPAVAATGEAALRMTEELHPDLVLMDILLKGEKDGIETAREIEDQFEIPIIFLTGQADESTLERVKNTSHYGFLLKPIDAASLFPTVEMALTRHAFAVQLKESENRFRAVTDSAVEAILSMDMQGNVTYWNKAAERTFGWTADEITGQSVTAIIPESAKAGFFRMLPELGTRETYVPPSFTLWRRKDGTEFPAEPSFASWKTKEGTFATAIVRDVSEQKKMEAAIAENEARFRSVVETATDAIITTNASGDIVFWNPAAEKMFGYTAEEARGKPLVSLAPQQMQKSASEAFIHFVQDTFSQRGTHESQAQRKDGSLFETETSYAPWTIDSQKFATSFVHDISDRKRTQERLASFNECLLKFGPDPIRNISSLTALCGDLLEASSAFYVHFGEQNEAWGRWNAPEGWGLGEFSDGQLLFESAQRSALEPAVIRDLSRSEFAQTDPSVQRYNWQTYIGTLAIAAAEPVGALALIFTDDRSPSTEDLRIVQLTVSAIGVEESRWTAQQEIKQREAQQKAIFESVQTGIALIDPKTHRIVDVNTTAAHLFGASKEAIIGSVCHRFICPAAVGRCPITDLGQTVDNAERVLLTADGKSRPILKSVSKITLGGHAYLLESFIDISDRKQMELALLESEAYYRAIFESTATGMAIVEEDMTVAMVNGILEHLTGYSKNEVEGLKPWTDFVAPEDLELMKTYHRTRRRDDGSAPKGYEFRLLTKDGTRREAFLTVALIPGTRRSVVSIVDLTALKTAQEAVRKQAGMLDAAHDAIMTLDPEGTITYWNRGAERLYGWTKQEVTGQNANALLITTFPESREALWPKLMESGLWEGELIHVTRDGIPVTVASSWTLLKDEKGNASAILEISSDITERKKAQLALADSEAKLRITFASMTDGIVLNGLDRKVTDCNEAVLRLTQRSREEIIGKPFTDLLAPEFRSQILETIPELLEKGAIRTNSKMLRKNGESVDVEANVSLIKDAAGQPTAFLTVTRDVTERKKAELALADSEAKLRITFATMADGIVIVGLDEKVIDCNEAILRLTQRSREEIIGKPSADLLAPEFRSQIPDARKFLVGSILTRTMPGLREKGGVRTDSQLLRKNGESVDIEANISVIEDAVGQPGALLIVARDVTERKKMEQQLNSTLADLQRSNAELEQFAYIASHDLQEPLRMIASYIQLIEEDYKEKLDADADQYIAFAVEGAKRMQTLIEDLLAYSRVGTRGEPLMPTSMKSALSEAIANLEVAIEESHAVVTHDQLPTVLGDESQLIQLFQNLVGNAIKFKSDDAPAIHVGVEETKDDWVFSVRDNGIGIDMKYAERIFTVFQRLHSREEYAGTGIGLAVVKKIVERHGGRIWVESTPAKGSTFYFTLRKRGDSML